MRLKSALLLLLSVCVLFSSVGCVGKKVDNKPKVFTIERFTHNKGLPCEEITSLASLGGKIWAGSKKGLFIFDGVNWEIHGKKNNNKLGSDNIIGLQSLNRCMWVATDNGACFYDGNGFNSIYTRGKARAVTGSSNGNYAIGTAYGVIVNGSVSSKSSAGIISDDITCLFYDKQGQLIIGTRFGISKITTGFAQNYSGPAKTVMGTSLVDIPASPANCRLCGNNIKTIIGYKGSLAIGTTEGLCLTDLASFYKSYTAEHKEWTQRNGKISDELVKGNSNIPGNKIVALAKSDNDELLFVITNNGLGILKGEEWLDVDKLIPGLQKEGLSSVAWCQNDLWIGTEKEGIMRIKDLSSLFPREEPEQ